MSVTQFEMYEYALCSPAGGGRPGGGANQRVIETLDMPRQTVAQVVDDLKALVPILRNLVSAAPSLRGVAEMLHKTPRSQSALPRTSPIIEMFTQIAEQPSRHCVEVVQLARVRLSSAVSFQGPSWTLPLSSHLRFELRDASRFGALPEPAGR